MFLVILAVTTLINHSEASAGDHSPYYQRCVEKCGLQNCTDDGLHFDTKHEQPVYLALLQWTCEDECRYECMWGAVKAFEERKWRTPQFYGKWPFIRLFGIQEPASVVFSLLNFFAHLRMIRKFRKEVPPDSPLYWLWHFFCLVSLNAWLWSSIFHTRDFPLTEFMDYACAFSMIITACYCMIMRFLYNSPGFVRVAITATYFSLLANHIAYLSVGRFDYGYNMEVNILIGTFTAICWFGWCTYYRTKQPYVWKCAAFVVLTGVAMLLEIVDMPPIFWVFDFHSLWHLSTAPLVCLFYNFIIDDCKFMRKTDMEMGEEKIIEVKKKRK